MRSLLVAALPCVISFVVGFYLGGEYMFKLVQIKGMD